MLEFLYHALVVFGAIVLVVIALVIVTILERRREEPRDNKDGEE